MKLRLILDVEYNPHDVPEHFLRSQLEFMVENAMGNGLVTGESDAEVETWEMHTHRVDRRGSET